MTKPIDHREETMALYREFDKLMSKIDATRGEAKETLCRLLTDVVVEESYGTTSVTLRAKSVSDAVRLKDALWAIQ